MQAAAIEEAKIALAGTTDMNPALKKAGVSYRVMGSDTTVTAQLPAAGSVISNSSTAILYLGAPMQTNQVTVPDLSGMTAAAANAKLASCELNIRIEGTNNYLSGTGAVAVSQGTANAGKRLYVNAAGDVEPITIATLKTLLGI